MNFPFILSGVVMLTCTWTLIHPNTPYQFQAFIIASTATEDEMQKWYAGFSSSYFYMCLSIPCFNHCYWSSKNIWVFACWSRYNEHVVWGDKDLKLRLLRKGVLTRIYSPMVSDKHYGCSVREDKEG